MNVVCKNCHCVYSVGEAAVPMGGGEAKCPICDYPIQFAEAEPGQPPAPEHDYGQTMVLFTPLPAQQVEQQKRVSSGISGEQSRIPAGRSISLKVVVGDRPGWEYRLTKPRTVIGRNRADVKLDDPEVSRRHASIEVYGDKVVINDLGSTNGTFVNSLAVRLSYLRDGDFVQVGNTRFEVTIR